MLSLSKGACDVLCLFRLNFILWYMSVCLCVSNSMDVDLSTNLDWDPSYLSSIFDEEFNDMSDLWSCENISDGDLVSAVDRYCPIVEDITIEDNVLYDAVQQIEHE